MSDITFYMGLLKIFGRYINESILDDNEKEIFDEMIHRSDNAIETGSENPNIIDLRKVSIKELVAYDIEMQLYDEFNDKFCEINQHMGDIYSRKDLHNVELCEKARKKELIRNHINSIKELLGDE